MTLTLKLIPPQHVAALWPQLSAFIEDAFAMAKVTEYTVEEARSYLLGGGWLAIGAFDEVGKLHGATTISLVRYPHETIAFITSIGGRLISSPDTVRQLKEICRTFGATKLQGYARESVARLWRRLNFQNRAILVEAVL